MFTDDEKKKMVEYGVEQFSLNPEFLKWLIDEFNKTYEEILKAKLKSLQDHNKLLKILNENNIKIA